MSKQNKFKKGDRVIIHQNPEFPLSPRLRPLYGMIGTVEMTMKDGYIIHVKDGPGIDPTGDLVHVREENLLLFTKAELEILYVLEAFDEDMNTLRAYRFYKTQPTRLDVFNFLQDTKGKYVEIRNVYQESE